DATTDSSTGPVLAGGQPGHPDSATAEAASTRVASRRFAIAPPLAASTLPGGAQAMSRKSGRANRLGGCRVRAGPGAAGEGPGTRLGSTGRPAAAVAAVGRPEVRAVGVPAAAPAVGSAGSPGWRSPVAAGARRAVWDAG